MSKNSNNNLAQYLVKEADQKALDEKNDGIKAIEEKIKKAKEDEEEQLKKPLEESLAEDMQSQEEEPSLEEISLNENNIDINPKLGKKKGGWVAWLKARFNFNKLQNLLIIFKSLGKILPQKSNKTLKKQPQLLTLIKALSSPRKVKSKKIFIEKSSSILVQTIIYNIITRQKSIGTEKPLKEIPMIGAEILLQTLSNNRQLFLEEDKKQSNQEMLNLLLESPVENSNNLLLLMMAMLEIAENFKNQSWANYVSQASDKEQGSAISQNN